MKSKTYSSEEEVLAAIKKYIEIAKEMGIEVGAYNGISYWGFYLDKDGDLKAAYLD